jgi:hypothetical protein
MKHFVTSAVLSLLMVVATAAATADPDEYIASRWQSDLTALQSFRPGYAFWQHVFIVPDGNIAFGSAVDGRLLAIFPVKGDWTREGTWMETSLAHLLKGRKLSTKLDERRDEVAALLEAVVGPVVHNPTRGTFARAVHLPTRSASASGWRRTGVSSIACRRTPSRRTTRRRRRGSARRISRFSRPSTGHSFPRCRSTTAAAPTSGAP